MWLRLSLVGVFAGACSSSAAKPDCDVYAVHLGMIVGAEHPTVARKEMELRAYTMASERCHAGAVSKAEADCVLAAPDAKAGRRCADPDPAIGVAPAPAPPLDAALPIDASSTTDRARAAIAIITEVLDAYARAAQDRFASDAATRIHDAVVANEARVAELRAIAEDPEVWAEIPRLMPEDAALKEAVNRWTATHMHGHGNSDEDIKAFQMMLATPGSHAAGLDAGAR